MFRELDDEDAQKGPVHVGIVQVGCDCGWRSQRLRAPYGTTWDGIVLLPRGEQETEEVPPVGVKPFETIWRDRWRKHAIGSSEVDLEVAND